MLRYNDLHLAVAIDRRKNSVSFQQKFADFVRKSTKLSSAKQRAMFAANSQPIQIWSEEDVRTMAENHSMTPSNKPITKFGCL